MKIIFPLILTLILLGTSACTQTTTAGEVSISNVKPTDGSPIYMAGQVEWIAKTFSPECRIKKTDVMMTGG
jgi:hypothetical protein